MPGMRYVALLRGINVGGKSIIRMADLKECVEELGYDDDWIGNDSLRVNVAFLRRTRDGRALACALKPKEGVDELVATKSALIWATRRDALAHSGMQKLIGSAAYRDLTVRNLNTTLKLYELLA
jgi:uncharacterized protein (DUF1697 family)